jgi:hypothetical protein
MNGLIQVYPIGSEIVIDGDIPAVITAFEVRGMVGLITYQCTWWDERNRKSEWLTESEIKPREHVRKTTISIK